MFAVSDAFLPTRTLNEIFCDGGVTISDPSSIILSPSSKSINDILSKTAQAYVLDYLVLVVCPLETYQSVLVQLSPRFQMLYQEHSYLHQNPYCSSVSCKSVCVCKSSSNIFKNKVVPKGCIWWICSNIVKFRVSNFY